MTVSAFQGKRLKPPNAPENTQLHGRPAAPIYDASGLVDIPVNGYNCMSQCDGIKWDTSQPTFDYDVAKHGLGQLC